MGPMTRGDLGKVVAVPDIRNQVGALARRLVNALRDRRRRALGLRRQPIQSPSAFATPAP